MSRSEWVITAVDTARRQDGSEVIEVSADADGFEIDYEIGTGYMRQSCRIYIPAFIVAILAERMHAAKSLL